jgi:hypothetical protein
VTLKRPRDVNALAKSIVDEATDQDRATNEGMPEQPAKNPAAAERGRKGGEKGGKARAEALSPKRRSEIAQKAARTRWVKP